MIISKCLRNGGYPTAPQWWRKPIYYNPVVGPLERGPDFSFADGRRPPFTTKWELERRLKQVDLGNKIVRYLAELREAEKLHEEHKMIRMIGQERLEQNRPRSKGVDEIF